MAKGPGVDIVELKRKLEARIETVAQHLLPAGRRDGHEWRVGSLQGEPGSSLGVRLTGEKAGIWSDFSTGDRGDVIDLWKAVRGMDLVAALDDILQWLGVEPPKLHQPARPHWQSPRPKAAQPASSDKLAAILALTDPFQNSLAARYIRARGGAEPVECDLRCLPPSTKYPWPTMLGIITDLVSGEPMSLHFTMLNKDGTAKAPVDKPKRLLAGHRKAGGVIRLTGDAELTTHLGIAEGIESALAITAAMGKSAQWLPTWSAIDAGNLAGLPVIEGVERLTIFADTDRTGTGQKAAQALAARWHAVGREVFIAQPPAAPGAKRDWNDEEAA